MRAKILSVVALLLLLVSCANYKLLKPEPLLSSAESGYIELKDKKKDFELKQGKKYYITFPAPSDKNFYLVLKVPKQNTYQSFLTNKLIKEKSYGDKIVDEFADVDTMNVYPIDNSTSMYYWLIDHVNADLILTMNYRYAPQWRFKYENKSSEFKDILAKNRVDRKTYNSIGKGLSLKGFNFSGAMGKVTKHTEAVEQVRKQLLAIESIFPSNIINSSDKAYLDFKKLKGELEEEIAFQKNYYATLDFFNKEQKTVGNPAGFIGYVEDFIKYFSRKNLAPNVVKEAQTVLQKRLDEVIPFYEQRLSGKADEAPFDQKLYMLKEFNRIGTLYKTAGVAAPQSFTNLSNYINDFDKKSNALSAGKEDLKKIFQALKDLAGMPDNSFFPDAISRAGKIQQTLPQPLARHGKYMSYKCSAALNEAIAQFSAEMDTRLEQFREAEAVVSQVNVFKSQRDYKGMLALLKPKMHIEFLMAKYTELDKLSVEQQNHEVRDALAEYRWREAEVGLERFYRDNNFLNPSKIFPLKERTVRDLEDSLYITIDRVSRYRVNKFCEENFETLEDIDSLYADSVFLPAYNVTFSTGSRRELIQRKEELVADLAKMKENEFPAKAIKLLFDQFVKKPNDNGIAKARAVVVHGQHYKGDDKKTKRRVAEVNPWSSKWIVKPKEYRRVYAIPLTDNKKGRNRYLVRFNIRIPTEAKFPVYDVNIKLPQYIAKNAASEQWYEKITLNKKLLKNEGRFTISAPVAKNNYECQVTPVRMQKDKNNFLDIYFRLNSYKVHTLSVMAQKPIIKKH